MLNCNKEIEKKKYILSFEVPVILLGEAKLTEDEVKAINNNDTSKISEIYINNFTIAIHSNYPNAKINVKEYQ